MYLSVRTAAGSALTRSERCCEKTVAKARSSPTPNCHFIFRSSVRAIRRTTSSRNPTLSSTVIFFEDLLQLVVRQSDDSAPVDAGHGFCADHGVDDGFFRGLDRGFKKRADAFVGHNLDCVGAGLGVGMRIGSRKGNENITGAVAGDGSGAREAQRGTPGNALELVWQKWRVGSDDDDDGADVAF